VLTPRAYLRGVRSQAEVAAELGISVRQLQRVEERALARLVLGVCRSIRCELGDLPPDEKPCRISPDRSEAGHASRAAPVRSIVGVGRRAGLPRRITMTPDLIAALAGLFPPSASRSAPADAVVQHGALMQRLASSRAVDDAAAMHRDALGSNPATASEFRTRECADDVAALAAAWAPAGEPVAVREARARRAYARLIAGQLIEAGHELTPAARAVLDALDAEQRAIDDAARLAEEERAAVARAEEERKAAARARADERAAEVAAARARADEDRERAVRSEADYRRVRGAALVERIRESGVEAIRDHVGRLFGASDLIAMAGDLAPHDIAAIERALDKLEAQS